MGSETAADGDSTDEARPDGGLRAVKRVPDRGRAGRWPANDYY